MMMKRIPVGFSHLSFALSKPKKPTVNPPAASVPAGGRGKLDPLTLLREAVSKGKHPVSDGDSYLLGPDLRLPKDQPTAYRARGKGMLCEVL